MQTNSINNINFNARFLRHNIIESANPDHRNKLGSFIEITNSNEDLKILKNLVNDWGKDSYTTSIFNTAKERQNNNPLFNNHKIYALTSQYNTRIPFDNNQILGLIDVAENDTALEINSIQGNPKEISSNATKNYKHIGKNIINTIKKMCKNKIIYTNCNEQDSYFFISNGFKQVADTFKYIFVKKM